MNLGARLRAAACASGTLCLWAVPSADAATLNVSYTLSGTLAGDPTNPPVITSATGSLAPLGSITWTGLQFPNLATGEDNGTFTITFANTDTLVGNLHNQRDLSSPPNASGLTQILNVTGGTGAFVWYNGTLTGGGTINLVGRTFSTAGSGTLNTSPEPGSIALLALGLLCLVAYRTRKGLGSDN